MVTPWCVSIAGGERSFPCSTNRLHYFQPVSLWALLNGRVSIPTMAWPQVFILTLEPHWLSWEPSASVSRMYLLFSVKTFVVFLHVTLPLGCLPFLYLLLINCLGHWPTFYLLRDPQSLTAHCDLSWSQQYHWCIWNWNTFAFFWCFIF